jgi:haloalkane dehalogenase
MAWEELSPAGRERAELVHTPAAEESILDQNLLVRMAYTGGVLTPVPEEDLATYLAPYPTRESRLPLLAWARQIPLGGEPAELVARIEKYDAWLAASTSVPKLLITFEGSPTLLIGKELADWCAENIAALETVAGGEAGHHAQEDRPEEIAAAITAWIDRHELRSASGKQATSASGIQATSR